MGLKRANQAIAHAGEQRNNAQAIRSLEVLIEQLESSDPSVRSWAARDLREYPEGAEIALHTLPKEQNTDVIEDLFNTFAHGADKELFGALTQLLRSESAQHRVGAVEVLRGHPDATEQWIDELLSDADSDVRIFAIEVLGGLAHPKTPEWLLHVLKTEQHPNALVAAMNVLAEVGGEEHLPALHALAETHKADGLVAFSINLAIGRIEGQP